MEENNKTYELTNAQKGIWNTELFFNGTNVNNICGKMYLNEKINIKNLQKATEKVIEENDNFHIQFKIKDGKACQYFVPKTNYKVEIINANTQEEGRKIEQDILAHTFEILNKPLYEIKIIKYPDQSGEVVINIHHLISDAWTLGLIAKNIVNNYKEIQKNINNMIMSITSKEKQNTTTAPKTKDTKENHTYLEFINEEEKYKTSKKYQYDKEFWNKYLTNLSDSITIPSTKNGTNQDEKFKSNRIEIKLEKEILEKINQFCKDYNTHTYPFLMAVYSIYIAKLNNSDDFILGTPILNRTTKQQKDTLGMFVNTAPVRFKPKDDITFLTYIKEISLNITSIYRHQKYSYQNILEDLREKEPETPNLYQVLLSYQITKTATTTDRNSYCTWIPSDTIGDDMNIHFFNLNDEDTINIAYDYKTSKYERKDIENLHKRIMHIIKQTIENPGILLKEITITPPEELKKILEYTENSNCKYPSNKTISQLFEEQVEKTPNNIAVKLGKKQPATTENNTNTNNNSNKSINTTTQVQLTYKELNEKANQLAYFLREKGIKPNDVIALRLNKSLEMVIGILGIIKAGACYLPIDLSYPQERVDFMLKDSSAKLFLTNKKHEKDLQIGIETTLLDITKTNKIYQKPTENLDCQNTPDDQIYIIYTSGSTGTPKGVILKHRNVVRLIKNEKFQFDFNEKDVWTMFHSVAFDFSVWELYGCLLYGGKLILVPESTSKDPVKFLELLRQEEVTVLNQTPTYFYNLQDMETLSKNKDLKIRYIIFGGEALKPNLLKPWHEKYPKTKLINMYGITETTVHVTYKELTEKDLETADSNIGKPIPTLKVYIMDKNLHILPFGVEGEMCVSGLGVCKGYLNRPELNKEKFVKNPYSPEETLYHSADDAYLTEDGNLHYLGRIDNQVKIRGFRVETGEIENKLLRHPNIQKCVVLPKKNKETDCYLVAYVVMDKKVPADELKQYISTLVPTYMIPSYFVYLDKFPLTSNGKVDRKKLLNLDIKVEKKKKYEPPRNDFEETFKKILEEVLETDKIGIDDNILELGADSLTLMQITIKLLEKNYIVNIQDIYEQKTIREISDKFNYPKKSNIYKRTIENNIYFKFKENYSSQKLNIKNVLLTGATGYLGIHILNELINTTNANIYCLIRNKQEKTGLERLKAKLEFYFGNKLVNQIGKRIHVIPSDITQNQFGLTDEEYEKLGKKIDIAIHSAAIVSHYGQEDIFEKINVTGTNNVIDFCNKYSIYMNHISTTSISSSMPENSKPVVFNEHSLYVGQNYEQNIYIKTKFEAEYNIWENLTNSRLRHNNFKCAIYRLGNITARYTDGKFQENNDKNAFLNRIITLSKLDEIGKTYADLKIDLCPVDYCAKIIVKLSILKSSYSKVFHIYHNKTIKFVDLINEIKKNKKVEIISDEEFYEYVKHRKNILGIINDLTSNSSEYNTNIQMKNKFTINYMKQAGCTWPVINKKYVNKFFDKFTK